MLGARPPQDWDQRVINWFILQFDFVRRNDDATEIRGGATLLMDVPLEWYARHDPDTGIIQPSGVVKVKDLRAEILPLLDVAGNQTSVQMWRVVEQLRSDWGYVSPGSAPGPS